MITNKNMKTDVLGDLLSSTRALDHERYSPYAAQQEANRIAAEQSAQTVAPTEPRVRVAENVQPDYKESRDILGELAAGHGQQVRYVSNAAH